MTPEKRTLEDKITITYFSNGNMMIDLSKLGISKNDEDALHVWADLIADKTMKNTSERIIKAIKKEITRVSEPMLVDREYLDGLEAALEIAHGC